jgi:flagellar biosynthetic protein FliR
VTLSLASLPDWAFAFVLILGRVGAALTLLPGLGEAAPPAMLRAGFALAIAALLLPAIAPLIPPVPASIPSVAGMLAAEVITGLWLGWLARLLVLALPIAGQIIAFMLGITNVLVTDVELSVQSSALEGLFALLAPLAVLASGLYALPLAALAGSYQVIAPGTLLPAGDGTALATHTVATCFALALQLAAPFVLAAVAWQVAMALLARLVPRVPIYFVSLPGQILGGLVLFSVLAGAAVAVWQGAVGDGFGHLPGLP